MKSSNEGELERRRAVLALGSLAMTFAIGSRNALAITAATARSASDPSGKVKNIIDRYPQAKWPKPRTPYDIIPQSSSPITIAKIPVTDPVLFRKDNPADQRPPSQIGALRPPFPAGAQLAYMVYWDKVWVRRLYHDFQLSETYTRGITQTDVTTLNEEVGLGVNVSYVNLSAKLTESFSSTVQISQQEQIKVDYDFTVDPGKFAISVLWQLVEMFEYRDSADKPLNYAAWAMHGPSDDSGAWYEFTLPVRFINRTDDFVGDRTQFAA